MTTLNNSLSKTPARSQRLLAKAAQRRSVKSGSRGLAFAELLDDPFYRRFAKQCCPDDLSQMMAQYGFESAAHVAACKTVNTIMARMPSTVDRDLVDQSELQTLLSRSTQEAQRSYRLMRHALAVNDPMNQSLRNINIQPSSLDDEETRLTGVVHYAKPTSLQSDQSLAAYLRYLYRIATGLEKEIGILCDEGSPYSLANRRPDLAGLVLNESNLKKEVPTLELVNEILSVGLSDIDMGKSFYPIALPYDHVATTTREALVGVGGAVINDIAVRTSGLDVRSFMNHRWAIDQSGLLGLIGALDSASSEGSTVSLLIENGSESSARPLTLEALYNTTELNKASQVDHLMSSLDLDFDELVQLVGLYSVSQENGLPVAQQDFATAFLRNDVPFELHISEDVKSVHIADAPVSAPNLRSLNYLARLHHTTGLAFHQINTILALPGAAADAATTSDDPHSASRCLTPTGLRVLASYPLYRDAFGVTPEAYAAVFGELSPYWRAGEVVGDGGSIAGLEQTEVSFLATLFQEHAPTIHRVISDGKTSLQDEALASIVARGLGLSVLELETLISLLDTNFALTQGLDARGLGALYRLTTLCQMLGWPLLIGLDLIAKVSHGFGDNNALWNALISRNITEKETNALCSALDWLVAFSVWMVKAELTPDSFLAFLTPTTEGTLRADDEDSAWLDELANDVSSFKASPETFLNFTTWQGAANSDIEISTVTWHDHLTRLDPIYWPSGVLLTNTDNETIEHACLACLTAAGVDFEQGGNAKQLHDLVIELGRLRDAQRQLIQSRVATLDPNVSAISAEPLILWSQTTCLDLLEALLGGPSEQNSLYWLSEIRRHIAVTNAFELGDVDLWLIAYKPQWLAPDLADNTLAVKPLDLAHLFALRRFATVQVGPATDTAWRGYLALTNEEQPSPEAPEELAQWIAGCRETLALLMGCPAEDMAAYLDALFGENSVASNIEQIETLARYIRLAEELCVSASHLLAMKGVSDSQVSGDWNATAVAAQAGLSRFENGSQVGRFRQQLAECERDALVAAFMQSKIANDDDLRDEITDSEKLYSYLLLDVNVTSAVPTSRLVEATSSLQLYISRALAGLEPGASFVDAFGHDRRDALAAQWELDKNYRQWEANQKLLLYPQNYIEPELRYITSPEFDSLLQAVSGGDVSPDSVEAAVNAYMNGLASACDLSVCSFFAERHTDGTAIENASYHVLAKAKWEPGRFFYRKLDADYQTIAELADQSQYLKAMDWTYWQEVSIPKTFELFSDVTVCVFKNRYYFLWLEIEERQNQMPDGPQPSWRLHPRYMRCDQNALVGPMLIPGVFIEGKIHNSTDTLTLDGAFEWSGSKPILNGTYHPTRAPDGLVYGQLNESNDRSPISKETFTVTFGVDFMGQSGAAVEQAGQVPQLSETGRHRAALHIRLSEGWSDAIINLGAEILTHFDHKAPNGYQSIYPNLVLETNAVALQYNVSSTPDTYTTINGFYDNSKVDASNSYKPGSAGSTITFLPAAKGSANLGSIGISIDLGERVYNLTSHLSSAQVKSAKENAGTKLRVRFIFEFLKENAESPMISTTEAIVRHTNIFDSKGPVELKRVSHHMDFYSATCSHSTDEQFSTSFSLPNDWSFDGETKAGITVKVEVTREFGSMTIITNTGHGTVTPKNASTILDIGKFDLRPPTGKNNSAWVETGEHGSRNFMHLTDKESRLNDDTFVLLNSSSVLSKLAKTMPRPGGCETLFTAKNQEQAEDYGTFFESDSFPATLDEIYPDDTTELNPARLPSSNFDFDSAYGAYGWEVFYDIPAAIAGGYANSGQFDLALSWLQKIFDPQREIPWRVKPLANATAPQDGLAFDTGEIIVDPDRIARDYPFYYQQATIRQYLEVMLEAGDAAYEDQTQESLQRAKALYVSAKQLFSNRLSEILQSVSNTPWLDPTLGTAAGDGYDGFLPPYNDELKGIHATLEARLSNLRQWLDLQGEPLNVPLLAQSIDPRQLQRTAKAALTLRGASAEEAEQTVPPFDFSYVIKSVKGYLNNLKLTSHRLQDANEKEGDSQMEEFRMDAAIRKSERAVDLHDFAIMAAEKEVAIKEANVSTSTIALTNHLAQVLAKQFLATTDTTKAAITRIKASTMTISNVMLQVSGSVKATIPNTFGFSNGGQNLEQAEMISSSLKISRFLYQWDAGEKSNKAKKSWDKVAEQLFKTGELSSALGSASLALQKANIALEAEKAMLNELNLQSGGAQNLRDEWDLVFGGTSFYKPFREDLELLYAQEWAATQEFCRLLVRLYDDEFPQRNGAAFLRTTSLGSGVKKFNAPHRLAVEVERLETAYLQATLDGACGASEVPFVLSEVPALGQDHSALEALVTEGEAYFEITDEMFDVFYPGQYDRRIQSININFPGLAKAGINPHARLTQTSNTRYLTRERSQAKGAKTRKDRHALQSLVVGACEADSKAMDAPDGLLKRFQNTGVTSCWHLVIPSVLELKRSKSSNGRSRAWRDAASQRYEALKPHLTEVELKIRFSGRW